ncbi:MAG: PQQ-binding-like beta-propeller repeat protein [Planctomycetes bacterium]|nr:PQQ-binding-like beta-propeller repeat protein [Planctomycetota bacterium]
MGGFRGDLSTLGLGDIFQTLSNSQKEGTLVVGDGESRKCIYFGKEGLSLISLGSRKGLRIGDLLVKTGKISPDQLKDLLAQQRGSGKKLGELVVERDIATEEDVSNVIRAQIEDEIFDLFSWKKASFEFIDGPPAPELTDADKPVTSLKFDVNSLLFEASRRIDEWTLINQAIHSVNTIFILTEAGEEIIKNSDDPSVAVIGTLADATRTVDQIVEESGLSRFQACKALYTFLTKAGIRQVSQDELVAMGKRLAYQGDRERAVRILACAVDLDHENLAPQQEIALILRQAERNDEAFVRYLEMGKIWEQRGRAAEALQAFKQALECKPSDGEAAYHLFRLLHAGHMGGDAVKLGDQLFPALAAAGDRVRAREVGEILAGYRPADIELHLRLAALSQDSGDQESCGRHLTAAINHLPPGSEDAEALARKVLQVLPNRTDMRFKVERILSERRAAAKRRMVKFSGAAAVAAVLALLGIYAWYEVQARKAWADILREGDALVVRKDWEAARGKYDEIRKRFGISLVARKAADKIAEVERLKSADAEEAIQRENERKKKEQEEREGQLRRMTEAKEFEEPVPPTAPRLPEARKIYEEVLQWAENQKDTSLADGARKGFQRVDDYLRRAEAIAEQAARHLREGEVDPAHQRIRELLGKYPKSPQALSAELPYLIQSIPAKAQVYLGGQLIGTTPQVVSMRAEGDGEILVRLKTFRDSTRKLVPGTPLVTVELGKECLWKRKMGGAIVSTPVVEGGRIMFGCGDQKFYCIDAANRDNPPWKAFETSFGGQIESSAGVLRDRVYFGANDGIMYCLDALKGTQIWKGLVGKSVKGTATFSPDGSLVLIGADDGKLWAFDAVTGDKRWESEGSSKFVRSRPWCSKDRAYFGAGDHKLHSVDLATGKEKWAFQTGGPVSGAISIWNSMLVAGSEDGHLYLIGLDGEMKWKYKTDKGITGGACISGDVAYFGSTGALHAVDLALRKEAWTGPFLIAKDKAIRGTPVAGDDAVYFGAEDGVLYALEAKSGELRWKYVTDGPILGSPALAGNGKNYIFVCSSGERDGQLYALER